MVNIKEAKEQIKNAVTVYFSKDQFGDYVIPPEVQRPVFLMGPPGIGKTAIMQQIANEAGVGLLSYSMTHHTRQSALGLPFISHKEYGGKEYSVSEYTMSEIIAAVYDYMEDTGVKEGILFLDEINCTSETLAPLMLQFLQYKTFGRHKLPDGWIVVTAGNPPEYNNAVREFDLATWDRLRRVDVEPNYDVWKEFALSLGIHPAVMSYLETVKKDFYCVENTIDGKFFVTARGWSDLSAMITLYEEKQIKIDQTMISQYLQHPKLAKEFAMYYDLFNKYRSDYQVSSILEGNASADIKKRAKNARFDERLALIGLILKALHDKIVSVTDEETVLKDLLAVLKKFKKEVKNDKIEARDFFSSLMKEYEDHLVYSIKTGTYSSQDVRLKKMVLSILQTEFALIKAGDGNDKAFKTVKRDFDKRVKTMEAEATNCVDALENVFAFAEAAFDEGQELLILVSELTINKVTATFISNYGCEAYFKHNKELLFYERQKDIINSIEELKI